jgi:hypothetical protein
MKKVKIKVQLNKDVNTGIGIENGQPQFNVNDVVTFKAAGETKFDVIKSVENWSIEGLTYDLTYLAAKEQLKKIVNVFYLESVGTFIDTLTLMTGPDPFFHEDESFHLEDITNEEWWNGLSERDHKLVIDFQLEIITDNLDKNPLK